jgi:hypothetical protein
MALVLFDATTCLQHLWVGCRVSDISFRVRFADQACRHPSCVDKQARMHASFAVVESLHDVVVVG